MMLYHFDIIKSGEYDTESDHLVNAELNLATKDLSLLGINSIQVSQNRGVYFSKRWKNY